MVMDSDTTSLLTSQNVQTVLVGGTVFLLVAWLLKRRNADAGYLFPPGPRPWPVVGNLPHIAWAARSGKLTHEFFSDLSKQYGDIVHVKFGPYHTVCLHSLSTIKQAFSQEEFSGRPTFFHTIKLFSDNKGVILSNGEEWKQIRRFTLTTLRDFGVGKKALEQRIQEEANELVNELEGNASDVKPILSQAVSNIICSVVFGDRYDYGDAEFIYIVSKVQEMVSIGNFGAADNFFPWLRFTPMAYKRVQKITYLISELHGFVKQKIDGHRSSYDPDGIRDFIDLYIQAGLAEQASETLDGTNYLTEKNFFHAIIDLFIAGTETTATTLSWALLYLVREPEYQAKCRQEIVKVVGSSRPPVMADRQHMPYLDAVIHETLRMSSLAPLGVVHTTTADVKLGDYVLPTDTMVFSNIYHVHMDPQHWSDPDKFLPERWLDNDGKVITHEAFMPFAVGKRVCLGEMLARMELFLFLTTLLQRLEFHPQEAGHPPGLGIMPGGDTVRSPQPYGLKIHKI